jgi:hypothetical protein
MVCDPQVMPAGLEHPECGPLRKVGVDVRFSAWRHQDPDLGGGRHGHLHGGDPIGDLDRDLSSGATKDGLPDTGEIRWRSPGFG